MTTPSIGAWCRSCCGPEATRVCEAASAPEAFATLAEESPELILMDIRLPGMDGLAATRKLKADPATSEIPVVAVTSCAMKGDEEEARAAGWVCLCNKAHR
jgi:two-component system, cell cycle response regulator DivK